MIDMILDGSKLGFGAALGAIIAYEGTKLLGGGLLALAGRVRTRLRWPLRRARELVRVWASAFITPKAGNHWQATRNKYNTPKTQEWLFVKEVRPRFDGLRGKYLEVVYTWGGPWWPGMPESELHVCPLSSWETLHAHHGLYLRASDVTHENWY